MALEHSLQAAQGYIELDMPDAALKELDNLSSPERGSEDAIQMRLFVLMRSKRWPEALDVCARMREMHPECSTGYVHGAFCLHEQGNTAEARNLLLSGPSSLKHEATYHYNLGCYEAVLGNFDEAQSHLQVSFKLDEKFREIAKFDPDLKAVSKLL